MKGSNLGEEGVTTSRQAVEARGMDVKASRGSWG
jgi:hypothetical protein